MSDQYLEAGFDPQGLKMSAIRNILNKHSVDFPSNAKKSELLGILQRGVLDQASKLRKEAKKQKRVKADGRDIEVVPPGVSAIGERTRARTPKAAERTRPALVKRDTKDEAVKAAPAAAEPIAKAPAAAIAKAPAAVPIARAPVTPIAKAKTISKAPVTPVSKAASVSKGPPTPLSRPLLPTIAKGPSTPIGKAPSTPIAKAAVAPAAVARAPTAAVKVSSKSTTKVSSASDAVDKTKRKSKKIKREQLAATAAATESPPPKSTMDKAVAVKAGAKRKLSDAEAEGGKGAAVDSGDEEFYTPAKARINEAQRQRMAAQRGAAAAADEKPRKHVTAHATKERAKAAAGNFSDENPFQSSPETARKRRRKATDATQAALPEGAVTPLAALRKSQVSDLSFKVALPRAAPAPAPAPEAVEEDQGMDLDLDQHEDLAEAEQLLQPQSHVGDLVAQFQQQQQEQAEVAELPARDLSGPPKFSLAPPLASAPSARFTMTPDALRQLASSSSHQAPPPAQPPHHRRATTNQIHRLPPVAPRIAVAQRNPMAPRIARAGADSDGDSDGDLQRRRVATLRQHVEGSREGRHSRRSSVASTISEARGATGIPSRAMAHGSGGSSAQFKRRRRGGGGTLRAVASWVGVAAAALAAWRTHEQWALGFGNARAELAFQAPPAGSVLAVADAPPAAGSAVGDQIRYWAQYARAAVVAEPLSCPEHAECAPFVPLHAWRAAVPGPRDQWVVGAANQRRAVAVQCDAGHVISFPALAPRWVPRVPACVRDASAELRVRVLADALVAECAAHRGRVLCAGSVADHARALLARWVGGAGSPESAQLDEADEVERLGVSVAELRSAVRALVVADDFDLLFARAVDELARERGDDVSHVVVEYEDDDGGAAETAYFVARRAAMPLGCRARTVAVGAVLGNLPSVLGAVGLAVVGLVVSRRVAARRAERRAADVLVGAALRRLKRQARRHYLDPALSPAPGIPSLQLRDLLLLAGGGAGPGSQPETPEDGAGGGAPAVYYDPRARAGVWDRVRAVVERSANVRCRTTAVRGEPMRVWEWIGPLEDDDEDLESFSTFTTPFASPQRMLSSPPGPL